MKKTSRVKKDDPNFKKKTNSNRKMTDWLISDKKKTDLNIMAELGGVPHSDLIKAGLTQERKAEAAKRREDWWKDYTIQIFMTSLVVSLELVGGK